MIDLFGVSVSTCVYACEWACVLICVVICSIFTACCSCFSVKEQKSKHINIQLKRFYLPLTTLAIKVADSRVLSIRVNHTFCSFFLRAQNLELIPGWFFSLYVCIPTA